LELKGELMMEDKKVKSGQGKKKTKKEVKEAGSGRVNIGVSVNDMLWRRLRALAIIEDKGTGELLDQAIEAFLKSKESL